MDYQWFPGHMTKAMRQMKEDIKLIDLIIELLDARIPLSSRNPEIDNLGQNKARLVLLNKADLEQVVTKENLKEKGFDQIVQISAKEQTGIEELYQLIQNIFFDGMISLCGKRRTFFCHSKCPLQIVLSQ